jgi:hypothetical protein
MSLLQNRDADNDSYFRETGATEGIFIGHPNCAQVLKIWEGEFVCAYLKNKLKYASVARFSHLHQKTGALSVGKERKTRLTTP